MTHTTTYIAQTITWSTVKKTEKPKLPEAEEVACDILAVYDSLNKLHDTLIRLEYVLQRKNIEKSLQRKFK